MHLFSTTLYDAGLYSGYTDWHSHILPGVDDGVKTMDESLAILNKYEEMGVKEVWLTPHIMEDIPNTPEKLRSRFAELQTAYKGSVSLHLAAENMLDSLFEERLKTRDLLTIGEKEDMLLVETSYYNPPMDLFGLIGRIQSAGYHVILAHPERYIYMEEKDYKQLLDMHVRFQLNLASPLGYYGRQAKAKAERFIKEGYYSYRGTDIHRYAMFQALKHHPISRRLARQIKAITPIEG